MAASAALQSADLSRQVGAAILRSTGDIVSMGCNEVPSGGGGQYWSGDPDDARDYRKGYDANAQKKEHILNEIVEAVCQVFGADAEHQVAQLRERLRASSLMDLTEFGRAVHAEMEALMSAARSGCSVSGCTLYATTFGIKRVVFIEPYPKSLALELHEDSVVRMDLNPADLGSCRKVRMEAFIGVAPRRYWTLFSMVTPDGVPLARKHTDGSVSRECHGIRLRSAELNYMQREASAAALLRRSCATKPHPQPKGFGER